MESDKTQIPWFLQSSHPVDFPSHKALTLPTDEFDAFLIKDLAHIREDEKSDTETAIPGKAMTEATTESETFTLVTDSTSNDIRRGMDDLTVEPDEAKAPEDTTMAEEGEAKETNAFMEGLHSFGKEEVAVPNLENKTFTANGDLAFSSTKNPLVDLFYELDESISSPRLRETLEHAWKEDPLSTLKIVFNSRSIHLGKSSRHIFYQAAGWLAQNHPLTLVANLKWLARPVIEKKVSTEKTAEVEEEGDLVVIEADADANDPGRFDVRNGVAHGYWKDMLNILVLAANGKLTFSDNSRLTLNVGKHEIYRNRAQRGRRGAMQKGVGARGRGAATSSTRDGADPQTGLNNKSEHDTTPKTFGEAVSKPKKTAVDFKAARRSLRDDRHSAAINAFENNPVYRALHLTIARLFASQLKIDLAALAGRDSKAKRYISLCGKWAPTHDHFHDRHTLIVSSIAEILYPRESFDEVLTPTDTRETYLRHARERYRKDTSALRRHLQVVERDITAKTYDQIKYDRVPSIAMNKYTKLFMENDLERFEKYIDRVVAGSARISGATLLPSTCIKTVRTVSQSSFRSDRENLTHTMLMAKVKGELEAKVIDGQWKSLVQRIKDSGTLSASIAVCDVSGSMTCTTFQDGTTPMDSAIGLSLLVAEATEGPFGGSFITFSESPSVEKIDLSKSLKEKCEAMENSHWGMNTDFVAVFEKLILPMAIRNNLKQEDMVKRVLVFSDMQFDAANPRVTHSTAYNSGGLSWADSTAEDENIEDTRWSTSIERIQQKFSAAGYEMPELVFWNLDGVVSSGQKSKPVTAEEPGVSLVSGYSQGMLKVFLESGGFDDLEEEEEEEEQEEEPMEEEEEEVVVTKDPGTGEVTTTEATKEEEVDEVMVTKDTDTGDVAKAEGTKIEEEDEVMVTKDHGTGAVTTAEVEEDEDRPKKKKKIDPLTTVKKAIGHKAYDMLKVMD